LDIQSNVRMSPKNFFIKTIVSKPVIALIISLALSAIPLYTLSAQNLLTNPGFETGDITGWTKSGTHQSGVTTSNVYAGTYSLYIATASSTGMKPYYQNINVYTGKRYLYGGYVYLEGTTNQGCGIGVRSGGGVLSALVGAGNAVSSTTATDVWTYIAASTVVPQGVSVYGVNAYLRTNGVVTSYSTGYFDNVFLMAAPPPPAISELIAVPGISGGQINLAWTVPYGSQGYPNDPLPVGSTFYIQYASWTGVNFSTNTMPPVGGYDITIATGPLNAGTSVFYTVMGLTDGVTYYFRIWTKDPAGQWSEISTVEATSWAQITSDFVPPDAISNLTALFSGLDNTITLQWISPGDDGYTGDLLSGSAFIIQVASESTIGSVTWDYNNPANIIISTSSISPGTTNSYNITLIGGDTYYFRIWTRDDGNNYSSISNGATYYLPVYPPEAITDLTVTLLSSLIGSAKLEWTAPSDPPTGGTVGGYIVRYATFTIAEAGGASNWWALATDVRGEPAPALPSSKQTLILEGLPSGQNITFHIKSTDTVNNFSNIDSGTEQSLPVPPHLLISEVLLQSGTSDFIELYNPTDNPIDLQNLPLYIHQRTSGGTDSTFNLAFINTTIPGKGYFLISSGTYLPGGKSPDAVVLSGNISADNTVYISTSATALQSIIDVVSFGSGADVNFIDFGDPNRPLRHSYGGSSTNSVERKPGGGAGSALGNGFDSNKFNYDFDVIALNPQNSSDSTEPPPTVPKAPSWVDNQIIITTDSIKWVLKNEHTGNVDIYVSSATNTGARLTGGELGNILPADTTSWVETGLTPNTLYTRYGESYLVSGSSWSVALTTCTLAYPPTVVSATPTLSGIMLEWNDSGALAYLIERSTSNFDGLQITAALIMSPGTTHYDTLNIDGGTTYYYKIYVYNQLEVRNDSFTSPVVSTLTYPSSPIGFGKVSVTTTSITWTWTPPSGFADGYRIYQASSPSTLVATVPFGINTYEETGLSSNTAYGRFIKSYNLMGESSASNQATFYTLAVPPSALIAIPQSYYKINISWPDSGAYKYVIARSQDNFSTPWSTAAVILTPGTTHQDSGLTINTTYWYRIYAINNENTLNTTQIVATSTKTLGGPLPFTPIIDGTKDVGWGDVPNAESVGQSAQPGDKLQQLYITDDENYLYFGWSPVIEDPWNDNKSAHYVIFINTGPTTSTVNVDPWQVNTTLGGWSDKPEIAIAGWVNMNISTNAFGEAPKIYKTNSGVWGVEIGSIDQSSSSVANNWNELRISRSILGVLKDHQIEVLIIYRPAEDKPGITDAITYDFSANDWGDASSSLSSRRYYTIQSLGSQPPSVPTGLYGVALSSQIIKWEWNITAGATYYQVYNHGDNSLLANLEGNGTTIWYETGLSSNTQYSRYVRAGNAYGLSDQSAFASRYTHAYPPSVLSAAVVSSSTINLNWDYSGATKYEVHYSTDMVNGNYVATLNSPTLSYSHQGLEAGVTYYYQIMPVNGDDVTSYSYDFPRASTRTLPSPIVNFTTTTVNITSIVWSWSSAIGADGYLVVMATSPNTIVGQTGAAQTTFSESNLSTNTAYGRQVRAYNISGGGILSPSATVYTLAATPSNLQVSGVTTNSVSLSWSDNTNPAGTRYGVSRSTDNFSVDITTLVAYGDVLTGTNYNATGLSQNTTYYFRVWAYNGNALATSYTSSVSTKTLRGTIINNESFEGAFPPDGWWTNSVSTGAVQSTTQKRTGSYSVQFDNGNDRLRTPLLDTPGVFTFWLYATAGATTFNVEYSSSIDGPWTALPGTPITADLGGQFQQQSFDLSGLNNIYIRFYRGGLKTYYLDDVNIAAFSPDTMPPSPISNLTALAGSTDGEIKLKWSAPAGDDGGTNPLSGGYIIKYSSIQIITSNDFNSPSFAHGSVVISTSGVTVGSEVGYTFTNLTPGASYWFAIKSTDTAGNLSVWKSSADIPTVNTAAYGSAQDFPPSVPSNLTATANENMIQISWVAVSNWDLSHYELECDSTSATLWDDSFIATATTNTSYLHTGLENFVTYYYRVRAVDTPPNVLYSGYSNEISTYPRPSPPLAPTLSYDLSATTTDSIKWVLTDNAGNEQGLHISSAANTGARLWSSIGLVGTGGTTSWIETGFTPNQAVTRYGEASNAQGSNWSSAVTRYTRANPPINLTVTNVGYTDVDLSWSGNGNSVSTRYEVSISSDIFNLFYSTPIALSDNYTATTANIASLIQGATYWIRVRAFNGDNVATVFSSTISAVTGRAPVNYLKISNPGFELPSLAGWTKVSSSGSDPSQSSTYKRSGSYACKFLNPVTDFYPAATRRRLVSSTSTITAGSDYQVGLWAYVVNEGAGVAADTKFRIGIMWLDSNGSALYTSTSTELTVSNFGTWEKLSYIATAPGNADKAVMVIDVRESVNNNNDVYIDDIDCASDNIPPDPVGDLAAVKGTNPGEIIITWTAPGDDGAVGDNTYPATYILKYATYSLVAASSWTWYNNAITYYQTWSVAGAGLVENKTIVLTPGVTYYFLIRTQDAAGNVSEFDNNALAGEGYQASACAKEGIRRGVVINEVAPDQTSGQGYDFIELYNPGPDTPDIYGWEFYEYYTQDTYLEKVEGHWNFPANSYLVLRFNQTRSMTIPTQISSNYYELYTDKTGISQTDDVIMISTGGAGATIIDMMCYADMSGSLTNSTLLRAAYNNAVSTGQWFGPLADGNNDAVVERYMASTLYNASSNWSIARNNYSTDGTNPSYMEWAMSYTTTRGAANNSFDSIAPAAVNNLSVTAGDNRGTMRLTWTAVGDDGNTGTAAGYLLRYRTDPVTVDNFDISSNYDFASKDGQSDTERWAPKSAGQSESYLIGGFQAGNTYYIALKVQDERPNTSNLSNVVSTQAANIVGSNVRINEIYPAGLVAGSDWIEFYCARGPVNINGWKILGIIAGGTSETTLKTLPNITLQTGDYLVFNCTAGTDETDTSGKGSNGYWDVYSAQDLRAFEGVVTLKDNFNNIVDFVAYSQGTSAGWKTIWGSAVNWLQWSPASTDVVHAADWSGGDDTKSIGRDGFSTDTDNTLPQAKADWKVFTVPSKGRQNDDIAPGAITNLSALADSNVEGKITLTWTAPGDDIYSGNNSGGYYLIKYSTYAVSVSSLTWWNSISTSVAPNIYKGWRIKTSPAAVSSTESEIFTGLYPSVTYYFAIRTVDDMANWSELDVQIGSNDPNVQAQALTANLPPAKPTGVVAVSSNTSVILTWNTNTEPDLKEYRISSNTVDNFATASLVGALTGTAINVTGLTNGVTYYFWVQAVDNFDYVSSTSTVVSAIPIIRPPSGLMSNHRGTYVNLSWTHSPDSGAPNFGGYIVYRSSISASSGFNIVAVLTGGTTHQDTNNVETTTIYYYVLRTSDTAGPLSYATSVSTAIPDSEPPAITLNAPVVSPLVIEVKGSEIVFEATVADSQNTSYISGISTQTVKINFIVSGTTISVNFDEISNITNVPSTSRILSATFKTSIYAAKSGLNASLKAILESGGTFYYYLEAKDGVGNTAVSDTSIRIIAVKEEPKTSSSISAASGGTVSLTDGNPNDGETSVQIPQGSLTSDTIITIKQEDPASTSIPKASNEPSIKTEVNNKMPLAVYEFGPSGTIFAKPVTISLLYFESGGAIKDISGNVITGVTEDDLKIYTYDGVKWVYIGGTIDKDKNVVSAKVMHFSLYALFASKGAPEKPQASVKFITPNGDGINDFLNFEGSVSDFKEITIYDINGKVVRKIYDTNIWDAKDDSGKPVEIGAYIWKAIYIDGKSNYGTVVVAR